MAAKLCEARSLASKNDTNYKLKEIFTCHSQFDFAINIFLLQWQSQ